MFGAARLRNYCRTSHFNLSRLSAIKDAMNAEESRLMDVLDTTHQWPSIYSFKFIVPAVKGKELQDLIPEAEQVETRPSSGGKYTAYTFYCAMGSGREVLSVYSRVKSISGLVSL